MPIRGLDAELIGRWRQIQALNPDLASPFFAPEFALAAADQTPGCKVVVARDGGKVAGFFPFQSGSLGRQGAIDRVFLSLGVACPVGRNLSERHGLIAMPGFNIDPLALLEAGRIYAWDFHRLPLTQPVLLPFRTGVSDWHRIDLTGGYADFVERMAAKGSRFLPQTAMKARQLTRDHGPLRFETDVTDPRLIDTVLAWRERYHESVRAIDGMDRPKTRAFLSTLQKMSSESFSGQFSLLYAGERLAAGHFGLANKNEMAYGFLGYDDELARYSPGVILLLRLIETAAARGIGRFDLGTGEQRYKQQLRTHTFQLATGSLMRNSLISWYRQRKSKMPTSRAGSA